MQDNMSVGHSMLSNSLIREMQDNAKKLTAAASSSKSSCNNAGSCFSQFFGTAAANAADGSPASLYAPITSIT